MLITTAIVVATAALDIQSMSQTFVTFSFLSLMALQITKFVKLKNQGIPFNVSLT